MRCVQSQKPETEVKVLVEGQTMRLFFDFAQVEGPESPEGETSEQWVGENVDVQSPWSYARIVSAIILDKYDADSRDAIFANLERAKDEDSDLTEEKRQEYIKEYQDYQSYRSHAKEVATEVINQI
jgi:hypothetical protein